MKEVKEKMSMYLNPEDLTTPVGFSRLVPEKKKTIEWAVGIFQSTLRRSSNPGMTVSSSLADKMVEMYKRYNGILDDDDTTYDYLTKIGDKRIPVPLQRMPLLRQHVDQMIGEYLLRDEKRVCESVDKDSVNKKEEERLELEFRKLMDPSIERVDQEFGMDTTPEAKKVPVVNDVDRYMKYSRRDLAAEFFNDGITYLQQTRQLKERTSLMLLDYLLVNRCHAVIDENNGDPMPQRIAPFQCDYELPESESSMDKCSWFYSVHKYSLGELVDEYRDYLDPQHLVWLENAMGKPLGQFENYIYEKFPNFRFKENKGFVTVEVIKFYFQSYKTERRTVSKNGPKTIVRNGKRSGKNSNNYTRIIDDPFQLHIIGNCLYTKFGRIPFQHRSIDDMGRCPLPVVGIDPGTAHGFQASFGEMLKPIDDMYLEVNTHIRLALSRSGGKAVVYDVSQAPKQFGGDMSEIAYSIKQDGIIAVDGSQKGNPTASGFNQWKEVDMTLSNSVQNLINLKLMLEQTARDISGLSPERMGDIGQYSTNQNTDQSIRRSSTRTEVWFYPFDQFEKRLYERLAMGMKVIWKAGKKISLWKGDAGRVILELLPEYILKDYGFFIASPWKQKREKENLEMIANQVLSSASGENPRLILELLKIMRADSYVEAETIFENGISTIEEMQAQRDEQANKMQEAQTKASLEIQKSKEAMEGKKLANDILKAQIDAKKAVTVAMIYTDQVEIQERAKLISQALDPEAGMDALEAFMKGDGKKVANDTGRENNADSGPSQSQPSGGSGLSPIAEKRKKQQIQQSKNV